jgi:hypothetical protein
MNKSAHSAHLRTEFSIKASSLADSYRSTVGRLKIGPHGYSPDMTAPEGQSTGGGVQALQHLRLVPPEGGAGIAGPTMPTLLVGHANQKEGLAELRTFEHVDALCRERFKQGAPVDPAAYEQFLQSAQGFLAACGLRVAVAPTPEELRGGGAAPADTSRVPKAPSGVSRAPIVAGAAIAVILLGAVAAWLLVVAK